MHPTLNIAVKAARRAGQIINRASLDVDKLKVTVKQQSDFVTEVDRAAENAIIVVPGANHGAGESNEMRAKRARFFLSALGHPK